MTARWQAYAKTPFGQKLTEVINKPERPVEYRLLNRLNMAAVYAIIEDIKPVYVELGEDQDRINEANQFCGWIVGQKLREMGHKVRNQRGRVQGAPFKTGAIWE